MASVIAVVILLSSASIKVSSRCNQPLGMRDRGILDFQISATSAFQEHEPHQARPHGQGWCPLLGDPSPYLQVDFISTLTVEGVQLNTEGSFGSVFDGVSGNVSFEVGFGTNITELQKLPKPFHLNPLTPKAHMQTFLFSSPLQLRYLRIYPLNQTTAPSFICLRLEVIGCGIPDPLGIGRECTSPRTWFSISDIFVPYPPWGSLSKTTANTSSECLNSSRNTFQHYAVLYHYDTAECEVYSPSSAYSYKSLSVDGSEMEAFLGICVAGLLLFILPALAGDEYLTLNNESSSSTIKLSWEDKTSTNPGIIVSSGYPFYYQTVPSTWSISFAERTYGNLLFSNISLNVYGAPEGSDLYSRCEDKIHIKTHIKTPKQAINRVLSNSMNGQHYSVKAAGNTVTISFTTCAEMTKIEEQGKGFRVLAYASDTPSCTVSHCADENADIVSPSFLGEFSENYVVSVWNILSDGIIRIAFQITDFNVNCKTGTLFDLRSGLRPNSFPCNKNKPIYPFYDFFFVKIVFSIKLLASQTHVEGFKGHYWMKGSDNITSLATLYEEDVQMFPPDGWLKGLRRKKNTFVWSDGSPVIYTAWDTGQPLKSTRFDCTRANPTSDRHDLVWESVACDKIEAYLGVCEYRLMTSNTNSDQLRIGLTSDEVESMTVIEPSLYYPCGSGEIISILGKCDGKKDCVSGTDEEACDNSYSCTMDEYRCSDGKCLDISVVCDFHADCINGEDEYCDFPECSATNDFQCNSKLCINKSLWCDGKQDCFAGEDELGCNTCNPSTSFKCGDDVDSVCLPLKYNCDGIPDCQSGDDELDCVKPNTCQELWDAGYRANGMYNIGKDDIECDFSEIFSTNRIIAKYHNIDLNDRKRHEGDIFVAFKSKSTLNKMTGMCFHSIDQLCQPWIQELYYVDKHGSGSQNSLCRCIRMIYRLKHRDDRHFEDCDGRNVIDPNSVVSFTFKSGVLKWIIYRKEYRFPGAVRKAGIRIRVNPVVCYSEFISSSTDIACGNGITVSNETRCLYRKSEFGTLIGCRSLAHLQNCESFRCPGGFFKCSESFCLENRFVCDGEKQCQGGEDELNCGTQLQLCVSQYRCLRSNVCVSLKYLCDGTRQCQMGDDERFCNFRCPHNCTCKGMATDCRLANADVDNTTLSNNTKALDFSTNPGFFSFFMQYPKSLLYLSYLNMSACKVSEISTDAFLSMRNLLVLDMSYNVIRVFPSNLFANQNKLRLLLLTGNKRIHAIEPKAFSGLHSLKHLQIIHAHIDYVYKDAFQSLTLKTLDLTDNRVDRIDDQALKGCTVANLHLNGSEIKSFDNGMFHDLNVTETLVTDSYKFCCMRPSDLPETNCYPHRNEFSSCSDLMRNDVLRSLLWVIGASSLLGNAASLIYRFIFDRERLKLGYGIFVTNLAVADFLMGVYLITIAAADTAFRGTYIVNDESWRRSAWCNMAGVLSAMSSEASVLFICLVTVDRILVVKYPFGQIRFTTISSLLCSCIVWFVVAVIAILPILITSYFKESFYSKTGVCLALPLTRDRPPGWGYSIGIFIGFNFVTFLFIAAGQWLIYRTIEYSRQKMRSVSTARSNDLRVARNLLLVATTDFLCWFPVGILGFLAMTNHVIPGEVYAWTAVLVLPINSALNPFLYTLSAILGPGKFTPDKDEQARSTVVSTDVFDIWKSRIFVQPSYAETLLPLTESCKKKSFNSKKSFLTAMTVVRCLAMLHERDLCHSNLTIHDIYQKPTKKGSFAVALSLDPKLVNKEEEKQEEMAKFGSIVDALLKACHDKSARPGTSTTIK